MNHKIALTITAALICTVAHAEIAATPELLIGKWKSNKELSIKSIKSTELKDNKKLGELFGKLELTFTGSTVSRNDSLDAALSYEVIKTQNECIVIKITSKEPATDQKLHFVSKNLYYIEVSDNLREYFAKVPTSKQPTK